MDRTATTQMKSTELTEIGGPSARALFRRWFGSVSRGFPGRRRLAHDARTERLRNDATGTLTTFV
jgi:hypothetical protein